MREGTSNLTSWLFVRAGATAALAALAAAIWLWAEVGAIAFFETIRAGLVAWCG